MAVRDLVKRLLGYRLGGSFLSSMAIPPGLNYQRYLELYGEVGWLFGAISLIANSVAAVEWSAYQELKRGETKDLDDHPILDLLDHPNPFQTKYQFMLLLQTYLGLIGEAFIVLNFSRLRIPGEMWLAPPGNMNIMPSPEKYISHYEYKRGPTTLRLEIPEVIHIMDPNPANPYRGTGAARAISTDIDAEYYASRYQQRLFYNDATPGLIMEFPDMPPKEERENIRTEFLETHQGWRNARRPAFLWGGAKANTIALAPKDMEYSNLRNATKKIILGAFHIPDSLIGASEVGSRARAEADEYIFGKYTIAPALMRIREALNEGLCSFFDKTLKLKFSDVVVTDIAQERLNIREDFRAGLITREEARTAIGFDAEPEKGETFLLPINLISETTKSIIEGFKKQDSRLSEEQKEAYWQVWKVRTEILEKPFIRMIRNLWDEQKQQIIASLDGSSTADSWLFDEHEAITQFDKAFKPLITLTYQSAIADIFEGREPKPAHTESRSKQIVPVLYEHAIKWIAKRSLSLAKLLNGTTKEQLRTVLAEGFEAGESIPQIRDRIEEYYTQANRVRATMVARTEVIAASAEGNLTAFSELGAEKVEFYPALDERTCADCMAIYNRDRIKLVTESSGIIPVHVNCRCVWLPVIE